MAPAALSTDELNAWSQFIYELTGIFITQNQGYLIETRFQELFRETGALTYTDLLRIVRVNATGNLRRQVINAITTNETSFFRDQAPFELLQHKLIPDLIDRKARAGVRNPIPIHIWSAACSTGQEVYTIAIVLKEILGDLTRYDIRILGTDISEAAVKYASYAHYNRLEIDRGMPPAMVSRYFSPAGEQWKVRDEIRGVATFKTLNLLEPFFFPQPYDIIFCRNIAIYFKEQDRIRMFSALGRALSPQGSLIIGSTESLAGFCPQFEPQRHMRTVFYQIKDPSASIPASAVA